MNYASPLKLWEITHPLNPIPFLFYGSEVCAISEFGTKSKIVEIEPKTDGIIIIGSVLPND